MFSKPKPAAPVDMTVTPPAASVPKPGKKRAPATLTTALPPVHILQHSRQASALPSAAQHPALTIPAARDTHTRPPTHSNPQHALPLQIDPLPLQLDLESPALAQQTDLSNAVTLQRLLHNAPPAAGGSPGCETYLPALAAFLTKLAAAEGEPLPPVTADELLRERSALASRLGARAACSDMLWTRKYAPASADEVCGATQTAAAMRDWLASFGAVRAEESGSGQRGNRYALALLDFAVELLSLGAETVSPRVCVLVCMHGSLL